MNEQAGRLPIWGWIFKRKSTGVLLLTVPPGAVRSSITIWVVQKLVWLRPRLFQCTIPLALSTLMLGGCGPPPASASVDIRNRSGSPLASAPGTRKVASLLGGTITIGTRLETGELFPLEGWTMLCSG